MSLLNPVQHQSEVPAADRVDMVDALYRFAAGQDIDDRELFKTAFTEDAVLDFTQPAASLGIDLPPFEGLQAIADAVLGATESLDTTHTVTNARVTAFGPMHARLEALIEAQHLPRADHGRHLLLKNHLDVELVRVDGHWAIQRMRFQNIWREGDPKVLFPG